MERVKQKIISYFKENSQEIEHLIIKVGEMLFDEYYEFAWSYMVMRRDQLAAILPALQSHDFGILIEIILALRNRLEKKKG